MKTALKRGATLDLDIEKLVATGNALARFEGQVVFVEGAYPGDRVRAEIVEARPDFARARTVDVLQIGTDRQTSPCPVFERCGGCHWLDVPDAVQLGLSRQMAEDAFARLQRMESFPLLGPVASPRRLAYRRRAQLKVEHGRLGFYERGSRNVVPIEACSVLVPELERLLQPLAAMAAETPGLREIHLLAGTDGVAVALVADLPTQPSLARDRLEKYGVVTVVFADGTGRRWGPGHCRIEIQGLSYRVPAISFFQGNASFDEALVDRVIGATLDAGPASTRLRVLEIYAGAGLFTLPLAARGCEVTAVELDAAACQALRQNLEGGGLEATVLNLDASQLPRRMAEMDPDVVLVDPPRAGLDSSVRDLLMASGARRIVYLSCNLSTLVRDLRALHARWRIEQVEVLDLFPQTFHQEALAILHRRDS